MTDLAGQSLGDLLVRSYDADPEVIQRGLELLDESGLPESRLGEVLVDELEVDPESVARALAEMRGFPFLEEVDIDRDLHKEIRSVPLTTLRSMGIIPFARDETWLDVALSNPDRFEGIELMENRFGLPARVHIATRPLIYQHLNKIFEEAENTAEDVIDELEADASLLDDAINAPADLLEATDDDAPIIRLVNRILFQAVRDRASDIHIEPMEDELVVRLRIDGILYPILRPPKQLQPSIVSRVKIMAGMNIAEKRLPQDGRIRIRIAGRDIDIRASSLPTSHGERLVLRLLDRSQILLQLEDLGFEEKAMTRWRGLIRRPHGIILVTGPTGSGKTTTLYASLSEINSPDKNILTIEDPVEYQLPGIGQMNVNAKIDLSFAAGLRTILRQDPDVILVGEIRDLETAEIAIQASLTGHLVFSTLHTNDAPGALTRLVDMGVEPFLVASSLVAVAGQRLVRSICPDCRTSVEPTAAALKELGLTKKDLPDGVVYEGAGCDNCMQTGYRGRYAISELMLIDEKVRQLVAQNKDANAIRKVAVANGMLGLREDGARMVALGRTTVAEVLRVTQEEVLEE